LLVMKSQVEGLCSLGLARNRKSDGRRLNRLRKVAQIIAFCAATAIASSAQTFTSLADFSGSNGAFPYLAPLAQGTDGNLYGTTQGGGAYDQGTVFNVTPTGTLNTIYSFCTKAECSDGNTPYAGVILGLDGNFYGTTFGGGTGFQGTVFKVTPGGTLTTLYSFCRQNNGKCPDGENPWGPLIQATNGNFYGTTASGGIGLGGTIFQIIPIGWRLPLLSFDYTDGEYPEAGIIQGTDGNFYGTTSGGGSSGWGTVFKITPSGTLTTLYNFCAQNNCVDGAEPNAGVLQASDGNFYGTTFYGGASGKGTVFKVTSSGTLTTLYSFCSQSKCADGAEPASGLIQATDGNFYGTAEAGGTGSNGTVFQITSAGKLTTLYNFCSRGGNLCTDGALPTAGLAQATNGTLYGSTYYGGSGSGTIFSVSMGLAQFVETLPTSGQVGTDVIILGSNLDGATSVSFHGTSAKFNVVSNTEITTSVPKGATTGTVTVKTPSGTLLSNVVFRITN
jgi:uncharacterized repeat protein (TIGR03803 family)